MPVITVHDIVRFTKYMRSIQIQLCHGFREKCKHFCFFMPGIIVELWVTEKVNRDVCLGNLCSKDENKLAPAVKIYRYLADTASCMQFDLFIKRHDDIDMYAQFGKRYRKRIAYIRKPAKFKYRRKFTRHKKNPHILIITEL